ncbi:type II toxin-antitoxin system CcdA family antitoxin [Archaeoglobus sulfaticallidus]|uniref:type II toxin-antitoxin system CcdA family antitoxin n=1 Tax=Archaeoglobus sulfaticallidus TaxID=1316941 RepID=UPI0009DAF01C
MRYSFMPRPNLGKVRVNLTIRKDVLEASRQYIDNLSQFLEDFLLEVLKWLITNNKNL